MHQYLDAELFHDQDKSREFICCICHSIYCEPYIDKCYGKSHTFCLICIKTAINKNKRCPYSKETLKIEDLNPDLLTLSKLSSLSMNCPFNLNDCKWNGKYGELGAHVSACLHKIGNFKTVEANFENSGGGDFYWDLSDRTSNLSNTRLKLIKMEFTKSFGIKGVTSPCLSTMQLVFEEVKQDGTNIEHVSPKIGGNNNSPPGWVDKIFNYEVPKNEIIAGFVFYLGEHFYSAVGILTKSDMKLKVFGYRDYRTEPISMTFEEGGILTGFSGSSGWVIDKLSFHYNLGIKK